MIIAKKLEHIDQVKDPQTGRVIQRGRTEGFICTCGVEYPFHIWVFAHWDEAVGFTCPECGVDWDVRRGVVSRLGR